MMLVEVPMVFVTDELADALDMGITVDSKEDYSFVEYAVIDIEKIVRVNPSSNPKRTNILFDYNDITIDVAYSDFRKFLFDRLKIERI
jgi:hypothetical protein